MTPDSSTIACSRRRFARSLALATAASMAGCASGSGDGDGVAGRNDGDDATGSEDRVPAERISLQLPDQATTGDWISVRVTDGTEPLSALPVFVDGEPVGTTGSDGEVSFRTPRARSVLIAVYRDGEPVARERMELAVSCEAGGGHRWFQTVQRWASAEYIQYNPHRFPTSNAMAGLFAPYAQFLVGEQAFVPYLVRDWRHEDEAMVATLSRDVTWETGEPVDAADVVFQWEILLDSDRPPAGIVSNVRATGEYEVRFEHDGVAPAVAEHAVLHERADHPPEDWEPVHEGRVSPSELEVTEPTASGPVTLVDSNGTYNEYRPRDGLEDVADFLPTCSRYNWRGYQVHGAPSTSVGHQMMITNEIDGAPDLPSSPDLREQFPDSVQTVEFPAGRGVGLWFNHDREPWSDRRVRRAIALALDREEIAQAPPHSQKRSRDLQCGLLEPTVSDWLPTEPEGYHRYERDLDRARALLDEAGVAPAEVDPTFLVPSGWTDWVAMAEAVRGELQGLGFYTDLVDPHFSEYRSKRANGEYDLLLDWHSRRYREFEPYYSLRYALGGVADTAGRRNAYYDPAAGGRTVEIDGREIDVAKRLEALKTTTGYEERAAIVRDLGMVVNRDLPYVFLAQDVETTVLNHDRFVFPAESPHLKTRWAQWWLPMVDQRLRGADDSVGAGLLKGDYH